MYVCRENFLIVQPIVVIARFFGLCPLYYKRSGEGYVLGWSVRYAVYSYVLTITLSVISVMGLAGDIDPDGSKSIRMKDKKSMIIIFCDVMAVIIVAMFGTITSPYRIKKLWKLLERCNEVELMVPQIDFKKYRKRSILFIACVYLIFTVIVTSDFSFWLVYSKTFGLKYLRCYLGFYALYYVLITHEVYFWHMVYLVNIKLILLNEYIQLDKIDLPSSNKCNINLYVDNLKTPDSDRKGSKVIRVCFRRRYLKNGVFSSKIERIDMIAKVHKIIVEAVGNINNDASNGIPLILLGCLVHLVVTPYSLLVELMKSDKDYVTVQVLLQSLWIILHTARFLIIVEPCQKGYTDGQKTCTLICDLVAVDNNDEDFKKAVSLLNVQVTQRKIKFSCCNLFKIDRSIITTVAGTVTTYIVILFQFKTN